MGNISRTLRKICILMLGSTVFLVYYDNFGQILFVDSNNDYTAVPFFLHNYSKFRG